MAWPVKYRAQTCRSGSSRIDGVMERKPIRNFACRQGDSVNQGSHGVGGRHRAAKNLENKVRCLAVQHGTVFRNMLGRRSRRSWSRNPGVCERAQCFRLPLVRLRFGKRRDEDQASWVPGGQRLEGRTKQLPRPCSRSPPGPDGGGAELPFPGLEDAVHVLFRALLEVSSNPGMYLFRLLPRVQVLSCEDRVHAVAATQPAR